MSSILDDVVEEKTTIVQFWDPATQQTTGKLEMISGSLFFSGSADESAQEFFEVISSHVDEYVARRYQFQLDMERFPAIRNILTGNSDY